MASSTHRSVSVQMACFISMLCCYLFSTVATQQSCKLKTDFKDDNFPCRKWLHCEKPSSWASLSAEIKTISKVDRLCAIFVDCANKVTISNFDFQTIGGDFDRVVNVTISQCNTAQLHLADDMNFFVVEVDLSGNAFDSLDFMQDWESTDFEALHFHNNSIKIVRPNDFSTFRHLSSLRLESNLITDVESGCFVNNHELKSVDLSDNRLEILKDNMFKDMEGLKVVRLARNMINSMADGAFRNVHLDSLDLSHNDITTVPNSAFVDTSVVSLDLSHCQISNIPSGFLSSLQENLITLDLSYNNIGHVAPDAFVHLSHLQVVYHAGVNIDTSLLPSTTTTTSTTTPSPSTTTTTPTTTTMTTTTSLSTKRASPTPTAASKPPLKTEDSQITTAAQSFHITAIPEQGAIAKPGTRSLTWIVVAVVLVSLVAVVIGVVILRRRQQNDRSDGQQTQPVDDGDSTYDTIPVYVDIESASRDLHVYDELNATPPCEPAALNHAFEPDDQAYMRMDGRPGNGQNSASFPANGVSDMQPNTTGSDPNTTSNDYTKMSRQNGSVVSNEGPYEVPVLAARADRPQEEHHDAVVPANSEPSDR